MNANPLSERSSGILLHPTSLPGPHGVGDLGPDAFRFADFLARAGQTWWQMLPVGPLGSGWSPYDSPSSVAGSPLLISLDGLVELGLLNANEIEASDSLANAPRAEYAAATEFRQARLKRAFERFETSASPELVAAFETFLHNHADWLEDYAVFSAIKEMHDGAPFTEWPKELRARDEVAIRGMKRQLAREIRYREFLQFLFEEQWTKLRAYCHRRGVRLLGDVPMFVAHDGADVWANQSLFFLDDDGHRTVKAGVPPDYFSEDGQLWGNPLYRWDRLTKTGYAWWIARLRRTLARFDAVRLDHFIAFHRYWEIPASAATAKEGRFVHVPGDDFLSAARQSFGGLPFIAEDLGLLTPEVEELRDRFELPGMRVLQFGFADGARVYQPHRYPKNCVVYTGTHDNDTIVGWLHAAAPAHQEKAAMSRERQRALAYAASSGDEPHWDFIRICLMSGANTAIFPMQDVLGLGSSARMNVPGTPDGNWIWRLSAGRLQDSIADRLYELCELYERVPDPEHRRSVMS